MMPHPSLHVPQQPPRMTPKVVRGSARPVVLALLPPSVLCAAWIASSVAINPIGNFPLNDDWAFGIVVEGLVREGEIYFNYSQAMTLIGQVFWGALFCLPAGFSYSALRISTLALGLLGVLSVYGLLLEVGARRPLAFAGALTLAVNPVYLGLAHSFMTDVPFTATFAAGLLFVVRGLRRDEMSSLLFGLALAFLSMFIRQLGLAIFLGLCLASPLRWGFGRRWSLVGVFPLALAGLSLAAYSAALRAMGRLPAQYGRKGVGAVLNDLFLLNLGALKVPVSSAFITMMYVGLFMLPYLVLIWPSTLEPFDPRRRRRIVVATISVAGAITAGLAVYGWLMPLTGNILIDFGQGIRAIEGPGPSRAPWGLWLAITAGSALGATGLAITLAASARSAWRNRLSPTAGAAPPWLTILLLSVALLYCSPISLMYALLFERYLLPLIGIMMVLTIVPRRPFTPSPGPSAWAAFGLLVLSYAYFGIGSTHDLLDWNRVRWAAIDELVERERIEPERIDGGFEFNNWGPNRVLLKSGGVGKLVDRPDARYLLSKGPVEGFKARRILECHPWLPCAITRIWVLEREAPEARTRGRPDEVKGLAVLADPTSRPSVEDDR
jgi:hypothetical protein